MIKYGITNSKSHFPKENTTSSGLLTNDAVRELVGHKVDIGFIESNAAVRLEKE